MHIYRNLYRYENDILTIDTGPGLAKEPPSGMIAQFQLQRVRVEVILSGQIFLVILSHIVVHQGHRYDERDEAFFEGVFLFVILWSIRKRNLPNGAMLAFYIIGYGTVRFFIEFFREPDAHLGLVLSSFSMGQVLCALMIAGGFGLYFYLMKK